MQIISLLVIFLTSSFSRSSSSLTFLSCPLQWKEHQIGSQYTRSIIPLFPTTAAKFNPPIVRKKIFGTYKLGMVDKYQIGNFPSYSLESEQFNYEVLTNSNNCIIDWLPLPSRNRTMAKYGIGISNKIENKHIIGRTLINGKWQVCSIGEQETCTYFKTKWRKTKRFQRLISYAPLSMNLRNITYTLEEDLINVELIATDIIQNKADVDITQTITNSKTLIKTLNWDFDFTFKLKIGLSFNLNKNWLHPRAPDIAGYITIGQTRSTMNGRVINVGVSVTRDVDVPARTSVECISTVQLRAFVIIINGEAEFSAVGHSAQSVAGFLIASGINNGTALRLDGDKVVMRTKASLKGTAPSQSEFIVLPYNAYKGSTAERIRGDLTNKTELRRGFKENELFEFIESHIVQAK